MFKRSSLMLAVLACAYVAIPSYAADSLADAMGLHQVEITFHQAASTKNLDLMMSLFADDAMLTVGDKTYAGKNEIRKYFANVAGAFQPNNQWTAYTPAQRIRTTVDGNNGTLHFECLYVDKLTKTIKAHTFSDDTLVRSGDKWLIKTMKAGPVDEI